MGSIKSRFKIVITGLLVVATVVTSSISSLALRADLGDGYQTELSGFNLGESGVYLEKDAVDADGNSCGDIIHVPVYMGEQAIKTTWFGLDNDPNYTYFNEDVYRALYMSDNAWSASNITSSYWAWGYQQSDFKVYSTPQEYLDDLHKIGWKELNEVIDIMPDDEKEKLDEVYCITTIRHIDTYLSEKLIESGVITEEGDVNVFNIDNNALNYNKYIDIYNNMYDGREVSMWGQPSGSTYKEREEFFEQYSIYTYKTQYDLFNSLTVLVDDTVPVFETKNSDPTLITSARGDEIQIGDYLAPGALIYNTYNEDTDTTQKYILYEAPQTKKKRGYADKDIAQKISVSEDDIEEYRIQDNVVTQLKLSNGEILDFYSHEEHYTYYLTQYNNAYASGTEMNVYREIEDGEWIEEIYIYGPVPGQSYWTSQPIEDTDVSIEFARQIIETHKADATRKTTEYGYSITRNENNGSVSYSIDTGSFLYDFGYYYQGEIMQYGLMDDISGLNIEGAHLYNGSTGEIFYKIPECCDNIPWAGHYMYKTNNPDAETQRVLEFDVVSTEMRISSYTDVNNEIVYEPYSYYHDFKNVQYYEVYSTSVFTNIKQDKDLTYVFCTPFGKHYPYEGRMQSEDVFSYYMKGLPELNPHNVSLEQSYSVAKLSDAYFTDPVQVSNIYSYDEFTAKYVLSEGNQLPEGKIIGKNFTISDEYTKSDTPKLSGYPEGYFDNVTFIELTATDGTRSSGAGVVMGTHNGNESDEAKQNAVQTDVSIPHTFTVMIPKKIVLDGQTKSADYTVSVTGDISGDETVIVKPEPTVTFSQDGKADIIAAITQEKTGFTSLDLLSATPAPGSVTAEDLSAGKWSGSFQFSIQLE